MLECWYAKQHVEVLLNKEHVVSQLSKRLMSQLRDI